ncbi:MAG: ROK family protein [Nanoarchaeota archaeon]|nr:ROK family protein [Nanoarchaeota archaeon]
MVEKIAMDIGGTHMRVALVRGKKIVKKKIVDTPKTKTAFLNILCGLIDLYNSSKVVGIGIGIAGPVRNGKVFDGPNLPLKNFDMKKYIERKYKKRVEIANDVDCFALSELKLGSRKKNFIFIAFGTGIGGGIVRGGKLYVGNGYASEFGRMKLGSKKKSWEDEWTEVKKKIKREFGARTLISDLVKKRSRKGDVLLGDVSLVIGRGIAALVNKLDVRVVYIGGGVREAGSGFLRMINAVVKKELGSKVWRNVDVSWGSIKDGGLSGAGLLV